MQVGDLVQRGYPNDPGRIGLLIASLPKDVSRGRIATDYFIVQWTDGVRDSIRSQFLEVVNASR